MKKEGLLHKQARLLLKNERLALCVVIALMLLPYMAWLSLSVLALVTLRNGVRQGGLLVLPAFTAHVVVLLFSVQLNVALLDGVVRILPCYVLACTLLYTRSWRAVAAVFALMTLVAAIALHVFAPELINNQFAYFKLVLQQMDSSNQLLQRVNTQEMSALVWSNLLVGLQIMCLCMSTFFSLWFARMLQADLFYPGGLKQEMLNFRGNTASLLVLGVVVVGAYAQYAIAINCLPLLLCYFVLAGLSFSAYVFAQVQPFRVLLLLFLPCLIVPKFILSLYFVLGCLDSLVNFRLYLKRKECK
jgi:hypothetical protein